MLAGRPPFRGDSEFLTFEKILARDFSFPSPSPRSGAAGSAGAGEDVAAAGSGEAEGGFSSAARDLVDSLLQREPSARLGAGGRWAALRAHAFFSGGDSEGSPGHQAEAAAQRSGGGGAGVAAMEQSKVDAEEASAASIGRLRLEGEGGKGGSPGLQRHPWLPLRWGVALWEGPAPPLYPDARAPSQPADDAFDG